MVFIGGKVLVNICLVAVAKGDRNQGNWVWGNQ